MAQSGVLTVKIVGDSAPLEKTVSGAGSKIGGFATKVAKIGAVGAAAAAGGLAALVKSTANYGDRVAKAARETGLSTEAFQELEFAAGQAGLSGESFTKMMRRLNERTGQAAGGNKKYADAFDALDVSITDANGNLRNNDEVLNDVIDSLVGIEDEQTRATAAADIFGKKLGPEMASLIAGGSEGIDELRQKARDLGIVMSDDAAQASERFNDRLDDLKQGIQGTGREIGSQLIPMLADEVVPAINDKVIPALREFAEWAGPKLEEKVRQGKEIIEDLWPVAKDVFENLSDVASEVAEVIGTVTGAFSDLNEATDGNAAKIAAWGVAAGIVTTKLMKLRRAMLTSAAASRLANTRLAASSAKLGILGGALAAGVVAWKLYGAQQERQNRISRETKDTILDATSAVEGLTQAIENELTANDDFREAFVNAGGTVEGLTRAIEGGEEAFATYRDKLVDASVEADGAGVALTHLKGNLDQFEKGAKDAATASDELKRAHDKAGFGSQNLSRASSELTGATREVGEAMGDTAGEADTLDKKLQKLFEETFSVDEAMDNWFEGLAALQGQLAETGGSMDGLTEDGRANRQAFRDQVEAAHELTVALDESGASADEVKEKQRAVAEQILAVGREAGIAEDEILLYIAALGEIPDEIVTRLRVESFGPDQHQSTPVGTFHSGTDRVPGPRGKEVLARLQAGERVLTAAEADAQDRGRRQPAIAATAGGVPTVVLPRSGNLDAAGTLRALRELERDGHLKVRVTR